RASCSNGCSCSGPPPGSRWAGCSSGSESPVGAQHAAPLQFSVTPLVRTPCPPLHNVERERRTDRVSPLPKGEGIKGVRTNRGNEGRTEFPLWRPRRILPSPQHALPLVSV